MRFLIADALQAHEAIEYFNAFHDGFISEINLRSHDVMEPDKSHLNTGLFDVEMVFAHYNYDEGRPPYNQRVHARFHDVVDISLDFRGITFDWAINTVALEPAGDLLVFRLARNFFERERNGWRLETRDLFRFQRAEIWDD